MIVLRTLSAGLLVAALCSVARAQSSEEEGQYATVSDVEAEPEREVTGHDVDAAGRLFGEGRALIKQGQFSEACKVLERSRQHNTTVAVLLNLGLCHQRAGRLATAHLFYRRAEVLATLNGDRRSELAHKEASDLSSLRATLLLRLSEQPAGLEVRVDGALQPGPSWLRPMFIDAGEHHVTVEAPNRRPWQGSLVVQDGGQHVVIVPALAPTGEPFALPPPQPTAAAPAALQPERDAGLGTAQIAALGVAGAGIASLGAGLLFGIAAQNAFSDSDRYCDARDRCLDPGLELRQRADAHATRATVLSSLGALALAGGVVLWLVAPDAERQRVRSELARRGAAR